MKTFYTHIQKEADKIRMRAAVRRDLRERLVSYMEYHPLEKVIAESDHASAPKRIYVTERFTRFHIAPWQARSFASVFAFLLVVGVPYAAERAVPGDVLYPVKVRLNEEVRSQLALSPYEKIEWETRRVERRIAEARLLAKEGRLTDEVEAEISETVRVHASEAQKGLAELHESDADGAAVARVALESALDVQSAVLENDERDEAAATTTDDASSVRGLSEVVRTAKAEVVASGESLGASTTPSYDRFVARLEQETTRAHELFNSIGTSISESDKADIERRLEDINRQAQHAQEAHAAGERPGEVISLLRGALSSTQKLVAFMTDIDVRNTVEIESLVPKQLTNEERIELIGYSVIGLREIRGEVVSRVGSANDAGMENKVMLGIAEIDSLLEAVASSTQAGALTEAEAKIEFAQVLANDLLLLVGNLPVSGDAPSIPVVEVTAAEEVQGTTTAAE